MQVDEKLQESFSSSSNSENEHQLDTSSISTDNQSSDEGYDEPSRYQCQKSQQVQE